MSANHTDTLLIARRYATAIFAQALEAKKESVVTNEFSALATAIDGNEALSRALTSPLVSRERKAAVLAEVMKSADALTQRALSVVSASGRAGVVSAIASVLRSMLSAHRGELSATVTSARPLSAATQTQLKQSLAKATGKETHVAFAQNPDLLGGLVVELGSLRLDASLSGALNHMRAELTAPAA